MVNLFQRLELGDQPLTAALFTLLEHADPSLTSGLLERAGLAGPALEGASFLYPVSDAPPGVGEIRTPHWRVRLLAVGPGTETPLLPDDHQTLVISLTGRAVPGLHALSWEEFDRWLAGEEAHYDPESRTGFLLRQFRALLPEVGITYFSGFDHDQLAGIPQAFASVSRFLQQANDLLERLSARLPRGIGQVRQARPEDLLAGYPYRDYAGGPLGAENFLRIALHMGQGELQLACWLGSGGEAHQRLRTALEEEREPIPTLRSMEPTPVLWLWSPDGEQQLPITEVGQTLPPTWERSTVAVQIRHPFTDLAGEGLVDRVGEWVEGLLEQLEPLLNGVVH